MLDVVPSTRTSDALIASGSFSCGAAKLPEANVTHDSTAMAEGKYTDAFLANLGADAPKFTDEELKTIGSPIDFMGVNNYFVHAFVQASDSKLGYEVVAGGGFTPKPFRPFPKGYPRAVYPGSNETIVFNLSPEAMYWGTRQLADVCGAKEIFITESGVPTTDAGDAEGDVDRIIWLRAYLAQLQRATAEGVPVRGWFHWSTMDNLEWILGCQPKFGLFRVDMQTLKRTSKLSAAWFRVTARRNAVA